LKQAFKGSLESMLDGGGSDEPPSQLEEEMMLEIFEKYDVDRDGILSLDEFNTLQKATEGDGSVYTKDQQLGAAEDCELGHPGAGERHALRGV